MRLCLSFSANEREINTHAATNMLFLRYDIVAAGSLCLGGRNTMCASVLVTKPSAIADWQEEAFCDHSLFSRYCITRMCCKVELTSLTTSSLPTYKAAHIVIPATTNSRLLRSITTLNKYTNHEQPWRIQSTDDTTNVERVSKTQFVEHTD